MNGTMQQRPMSAALDLGLPGDPGGALMNETEEQRKKRLGLMDKPVQDNMMGIISPAVESLLGSGMSRG